MGLVPLRPLPKLKRSLAHLPEGPVIDRAAPDLERWLEPMLAYVKEQAVSSVRMGPPAFCDIHVETADLDRFVPRPPACFQRMWTALAAEGPDRKRLHQPQA